MKLSKDPAGLSPGANTRMLNDKSRAAAAAMAHNQSALNTLKPRQAPLKTPTAPPVGGLKPTQQVRPPAPAFPQKQQPLPLEHPLPVPDDPIAAMNDAIALEKFLGAPETSAAIQRVRLRNYFKRGDPREFEPGNDMAQSVMTIMQQYLD